jgi:hypothetical protein
MTRGLFAAWGKMPPWLLKPLGVSLGLGLLLAGLILLGQMAWQHIRHHDRYTVAFTDIECTPPPGRDRMDFLEEVQYLAAVPERLRLLDDDLPARLARAFTRHPMVDKVIEITLTPPRQVRVRLAYRTPVLAVAVSGELRAVDAQGVLLPRDTPTRGLPVYEGQAAPPQGPAGSRWGDAGVEAAARKQWPRSP